MTEKKSAGQLAAVEIDIVSAVERYATARVTDSTGPTIEQIRAAIANSLTMAYSRGIEDGTTDVTTAAVGAMADIEAIADRSVVAMERIADALERAYPRSCPEDLLGVLSGQEPRSYPDPFEQCEYAAVLGDGEPESSGGNRWIGKRDGGITHGPAFNDNYRIWRRPAAGDGSWERVR